MPGTADGLADPLIRQSGRPLPHADRRNEPARPPEAF
jgi:hypothetical protein